MPVSGRELASLDFANLIGGPLNAVVEAQAKSAITTANFIKEVAFTKEGKVVNVDFEYNRKNEAGRDQNFKLTVPFLTMLPVPYITIVDAVVEFNAKITSVNESKTDTNFSQQVEASAGGNYWFVSAKVTSKTAYQKKTSTAEKEERTFDMHVRVQARNQDMPAGTERLLTILENSIAEKGGPQGWWFKVNAIDATAKKLTVGTDHINEIKEKMKFKGKDENNVDQEFTISTVTAADKTIVVDKILNNSFIGTTIDIPPPA